MKETGIYSGQVNNMDKLTQSFEIIANQIERLDGRIDNLNTSAKPQYMQITNSTIGDFRNLIPSSPNGFFHRLKTLWVISPPKTEIFLVYSFISLDIADPIGDGFDPDKFMSCSITDGEIYPYTEDGEYYYGWNPINIQFQFDSDESSSVKASTFHDNIQLIKNNTEMPIAFAINNEFFNGYNKDLIFYYDSEGGDKEVRRFKITMLLKMVPIV